MIRARSGLLGMVGLGLLLALAIAGCGASTTSGGTVGTGANPTATTGPAATATTASGSGAVIHTATAMVAGKSETILTNDKGLTLYYFKPDTASSATCTGGCAQTWPPLLSPNGAPTSTTSLSGTLGVISGSNGSQVTYNRHPLYMFSGDSAAGDTHGEGFGGVWHVATPDLAVLTGGGGGGYGGY